MTIRISSPRFLDFTGSFRPRQPAQCHKRRVWLSDNEKLKAGKAMIGYAGGAFSRFFAVVRMLCRAKMSAKAW
jgi:hypothetical protein